MPTGRGCLCSTPCNCFKALDKVKLLFRDYFSDSYRTGGANHPPRDCCFESGLGAARFEWAPGEAGGREGRGYTFSVGNAPFKKLPTSPRRNVRYRLCFHRISTGETCSAQAGRGFTASDRELPTVTPPDTETH